MSPPRDDGRFRSDVAFLVRHGAHRLPHGRRTLLDHLIGVYDLLEKWDAPADVCRAGLFHSTCGTPFYPHGLFGTDDAELKEQLGPALELVAQFSRIDRDAIASTNGPPFYVRNGSTETHEVSETVFDALVMLRWANELEDASARQCLYTSLRTYGGPSASEWTHLTPAAQRYVSAVRAEGESGGALIRLLGLPSAAALNDSAAELPAGIMCWRGAPERWGDLGRLTTAIALSLPHKATMAFSPGSPERPIRTTPSDATMMLERGFTIYMHQIQSPWILMLADAVGAGLGAAPELGQVSAFVSREGLGVPWHFDGNSNVVVQVVGQKRWRFARNFGCEHPSDGYTIGRTMSAQIWEGEGPPPTKAPPAEAVVELAPGDVLFVPRGVWHSVETLSEESLHVNLQLGFLSVANLLAETLRSSEVWRTSSARAFLPGAFRNGRLEETARQEVNKCTAALRDAVAEDGPSLARRILRGALARLRHGSGG